VRVTLSRGLGALLAVGCGIAAATIALHHPLWPRLAALGVVAWFALAWRWPGAWLFVVPALLPVLDFSPWTGWIAVDEFDLLLLATLAAGHARLAWDAQRTPIPARLWGAMAVLAGSFCLPALVRGVHDAGGWSFGWFQGYTDPMNSLRVGKSMLYALAALPLIERELQAAGDRALRRLAAGMLCGLGLVSLAVLWERAAYPGLLDLSEPYRTTALFWEMHVGGAAIDGYLALATPFVAWGLWSSRTPRRWLPMALLALLACHACLTTFSRGVYAAVALPLLTLGFMLWARHWLSSQRWRAIAAGLLALALAAEAIAVLMPGSFMMKRVNRSARDYESRVAHWQRGLALIHGAEDAWLGIGLGRLPAHYAQSARRGNFSGAARWVAFDGQGALELRGPVADPRVGGLYGLTQQVALRSGYRLAFDVRTPRPAALYARVCESHLLYDGECQDAFIELAASNDGRWSRLDVPLDGPALGPGPLWPPRAAVLTLSLVNAGGAAQLDNVTLQAADGEPLVANGGFDRDLAHWLPAARYYFLPWHIDNLYLELLIERGVPGLVIAACVVAGAFRRLYLSAARARPMAPFLAASLGGALIVGAVSSLLDVPRVAFLLGLLLAVAWRLGAPPKPASMP
jgi:hypothetical protein